jgi:hypothetical protein
MSDTNITITLMDTNTTKTLTDIQNSQFNIKTNKTKYIKVAPISPVSHSDQQLHPTAYSLSKFFLAELLGPASSCSLVSFFGGMLKAIPTFCITTIGITGNSLDSCSF